MREIRIDIRVNYNISDDKENTRCVVGPVPWGTRDPKLRIIYKSYP
jgi:hypothetical protein